MTERPLYIDWATHEAAEYACKHWHYSRCIPTAKLVKIGVWEFGQFVGVVIYGHGASPYLGNKFGLKVHQCVELVRVAMRNHTVPVSKVIAFSLRLLKKSNPSIRLVVSFADPARGHDGIVYQAGNWIYSGQSNETNECFVNGRWVHMRRAWYRKNDTTPIRKMPGKHRYLMPLDSEMRERIVPLAKPYPKRAASIDSDATDIQSVEGGATPTAALNL